MFINNNNYYNRRPNAVFSSTEGALAISCAQKISDCHLTVCTVIQKWTIPIPTPEIWWWPVEGAGAGAGDKGAPLADNGNREKSTFLSLLIFFFYRFNFYVQFELFCVCNLFLSYNCIFLYAFYDKFSCNRADAAICEYLINHFLMEINWKMHVNFLNVFNHASVLFSAIFTSVITCIQINRNTGLFVPLLDNSTVQTKIQELKVINVLL